MKTKNFFLSLFGSLAVIVSSNTSKAQVPDSTTKVPVVVSIEVENPMCSYSSDGFIKINFSGGFMPYKVNGVEIAGNEHIMSDLAAGEYSLTLQDAGLYNGLTIVTIVNPQPIQVSSFINHVSTFGGQDAAIDLNTTATNPTFLWSTTDGDNLNIYSEDQTGLTAGIYNVQITDENGCVTYKKYKITQPGKPLVNNLNLSTAFAQTSQAPLIYPNPSNGSVNILSDNKEGSVIITNEMGLVIAQKEINEIGYLNLKPGNYTVYIAFDNGNNSTETLIVR